MSAFDEELEKHRKNMEVDGLKYTGQNASTESARIREAVWFLLAVAHAPGEPGLEMAVSSFDRHLALLDEKVRRLEETLNERQIEMPAWLKMTALVEQLGERLAVLEKEAIRMKEGPARVDEPRPGGGSRYTTTPDEAMAAQAEIQNTKCVACGVKRWSHTVEWLAHNHEFIEEYDVWYLCPLHHIVNGAPCCEVGRRQEAKIQRRIGNVGPVDPDIFEKVMQHTAEGPYRHIVGSSTPTIVCLCGSTRFGEAFARASLEETLAGKIVLTVGSMTHSDAHIAVCIKCGRVEGPSAREGEFCRTAAPGHDNAHEFHPLASKYHIGTKGKLDALHRRKIELADEILVLNALVCRHCGMPYDTWQERGIKQGDKCTSHHINDFKPYVGDSTRYEIEHALTLNKAIRFLNPQGPEDTVELSVKGQPHGYGDIPTWIYRLGLGPKPIVVRR